MIFGEGARGTWFPDLYTVCTIMFKKESYIPRDMFPSPSLGEEGAEAIVKTSSCLLRWQHSIRLKAMLKAVEFPAGIAHLATSLANMNRDALPHIS
jgi:hypothetical protein